MSVPPIYETDAPYYDWEHQRFDEDLQLYLGFAAASPGGILDVACGTGRTLVPLVEAGHRVTGIDSSAAMLGVARSRVERLGKRATLVCADMRSFALRRHFGMAFVALGSFHHLASVEDQRSALRSLAAHVVPGGRLIVDLLNPSPEWLAAGDGALVHQLTAPFPDEGGPDVLSKFVARTTAFETQTDHELLLYDRTGPDGSITRRIFEVDLRFVFRYEAELLLAEAGFRVRDVFGDYGLDPYGEGSPRMILVAERQ